MCQGDLWLVLPPAALGQSSSVQTLQPPRSRGSNVTSLHQERLLGPLVVAAAALLPWQLPRKRLETSILQPGRVRLAQALTLSPLPAAAWRCPAWSRSSAPTSWPRTETKCLTSTSTRGCEWGLEPSRSLHPLVGASPTWSPSTTATPAPKGEDLKRLLAALWLDSGSHFPPRRNSLWLGPRVSLAEVPSAALAGRACLSGPAATWHHRSVSHKPGEASPVP